MSYARSSLIYHASLQIHTDSLQIFTEPKQRKKYKYYHISESTHVPGCIFWIEYRLLSFNSRHLLYWIWTNLAELAVERGPENRKLQKIRYKLCWFQNLKVPNPYLLNLNLKKILYFIWHCIAQYLTALFYFSEKLSLVHWKITKSKSFLGQSSDTVVHSCSAVQWSTMTTKKIKCWVNCEQVVQCHISFGK